VPLPVLDAGASSDHRPAMKTSKMGRYRAAVLIGVHVIFVIHIAQWLITGMTISPVEPSEAMETLELGSVNAGFVFFVLALLSTFLFGRFFCGWGCHVVALQDLCAWMMRKIRLRPKPFRSRLLVFAPLIFGLYMFVWPSFKRGVLKPVLDAAGIGYPTWLREVPPIEGFHSGFIVDDFWATFPPWYIAVPFLLSVGFGCVYFLGSKGFCTYGCPYGGFFAVADQLSPARIKVSDDCNGCGHCTATCTSNVRVHEEVRDFGQIVDPGCMKCLDCVSVCPNDALSLGIGTPGLLSKPRDADAAARQRRLSASPKRFDLTWREEIALAAAFVAFFLCLRGMLDLVPMLMAAGLAGIATFLAWKLWSIVTKPNVRLQALQLKLKGSVQPAGFAFASIGVLVIASSLWSGAVRLDRWRAGQDYKAIDVPLAVAMRPHYEPRPEIVRHAERAASLYARSAGWEAGGFGWALNAEDQRQRAFAQLLLGDQDAALASLAAVLEKGNPTSELVLQKISLMRSAGEDPSAIVEVLRRALERTPDLHGVRTRLCRELRAGGASIEEASAPWRTMADSGDLDAPGLHAAASFFLEINQRARAEQLIDRLANAEPPRAAAERAQVIRLLFRTGKNDEAQRMVDELAEDAGRSLSAARAVAPLLAQLGEVERALAITEAAADRHGDSPGLYQLLGRLRLSRGDVEGAERAYQQASDASTRVWEVAALGESIARDGFSGRNPQIIDLGIRVLRSAADRAPRSATLAHDLGRALLAAGEADAGIDSLRRAVELAPENAAINSSLAEAKARLKRSG